MNQNKTESESAGVVKKCGMVLIGPPLNKNIYVYRADNSFVGMFSTSEDSLLFDTEAFLTTNDVNAINYLMNWLIASPWPWEAKKNDNLPVDGGE